MVSSDYHTEWSVPPLSSGCTGEGGQNGGESLWRTASVPLDEARRAAAGLGVPVRVARWLMARGLQPDDIHAWLRPERIPWSEPGWFWDMPTAVRRIREAVAAGERVCVIGDYDVDGVTASAIVCSALAAAGADWRCIIPHRVADGYGLSAALAERAAALGASLIVTVDNGICAAEAVQAARALGLDVVVTDHHEPGSDPLEGACAVVHWSRSDHPDGLRHLSGAGVAWKLAVALRTQLPAVGSVASDLADWQMGLAALGAVADVMPMGGENRRLVREGLDRLRVCRRPGWLALCEQAGVAPADLDDRALAFAIIPRLNAAGRMGSAEVAFALLMAEDIGLARERAAKVEAWNRERRSEASRAEGEAARQIVAAAAGRELPAGLVAAGPWQPGVVGLVAARLVERYQRPAIVFADDGGPVLKGSGRAPAGFPLHRAVEACRAWVCEFGGHEAAVGLSVARELLDTFAAAFAAEAAACATGEYAMAVPLADDYLPLAEVTADTWRWVERIGPFGPDLPAPLFYVGPVRLERVIPMGNGSHVRLEVSEGKHTAEAVWFRMPPSNRGWLRPGAVVSLLAELDASRWRGDLRVRLRVHSASLLAGAVQREEFARVYRLLALRRKLLAEEASRALVARTWAEVRMVLDTLVELGFAESVGSAYHVVESAPRQDLRESSHYRRHLSLLHRAGAPFTKGDSR
ncbi:MAG: single-stranded-DNA-specific exonuclease RecJ [Alicyclobacillaceae bacterium]|nr:single-stranded-DNA-specific exonuclease RecJ [Alicyclobacillaceae bacterium]